MQQDRVIQSYATKPDILQKETTHKTYKQDKICQRRKANVLSKEE